MLCKSWDSALQLSSVNSRLASFDGGVTISELATALPRRHPRALGQRLRDWWSTRWSSRSPTGCTAAASRCTDSSPGCAYLSCPARKLTMRAFVTRGRVRRTTGTARRQRAPV